MVWRHYNVRQSGDCELRSDDGIMLARYDMGIVETGGARVFAGHFVRIKLSDREPITGEDERSLRGALWRLARNIASLGIILNFVGLDAEFSESGLSIDTGWGYWGPQSEPIHMLDPLPAERECPSDLDQMIRETVDGMQIGLLRLHQ